MEPRLGSEHGCELFGYLCCEALRTILHWVGPVAAPDSSNISCPVLGIGFPWPICSRYGDWWHVQERVGQYTRMALVLALFTCAIGNVALTMRA
jgi:hypothetical protein